MHFPEFDKMLQNITKFAVIAILLVQRVNTFPRTRSAIPHARPAIPHLRVHVHVHVRVCVHVMIVQLCMLHVMTIM